MIYHLFDKIFFLLATKYPGRIRIRDVTTGSGSKRDIYGTDHNTAFNRPIDRESLMLPASDSVAPPLAPGGEGAGGAAQEQEHTSCKYLQSKEKNKVRHWRHLFLVFLNHFFLYRY
jgi:hypothetical protein